MPGIAARTVTEAADGLLVAPVQSEQPWDAVHRLRSAMRDLRRDGSTPKVTLMLGIAADGAVSSLASSSVLVLGYQL